MEEVDSEFTVVAPAFRVPVVLIFIALKETSPPALFIVALFPLGVMESETASVNGLITFKPPSIEESPSTSKVPRTDVFPVNPSTVNRLLTLIPPFGFKTFVKTSSSLLFRRGTFELFDRSVVDMVLFK